MFELVEKPFGNVIIASFTVPHTALITTAEVDAEGDVVEPFQDLIVRLERSAEVFFGIFAPVPHRLQGRWVHVSRVTRRIDLDVATTRIGEPTNHFSLDLDDIRHKSVHARINRMRVLPVEPLRNSI